MGKERLKDTAYAIIRQKMVICEYLPNQFLSENELSEEIGVSRTPIREAVGRLEQEGWLQVIPRRGIMVRGVGYYEIQDVFQARILLEPYILRSSFAEIDLDRVKILREELLAAHAAGNLEQIFALDGAFHQFIYGYCTNRYMNVLLDTLADQNTRIRILSGRRQPQQEIPTSEHLEIMDKILSGDGEGAVTALRIHLTNSRKRAVDHFLASGA